MRVIAGKFRGRELVSFQAGHLRPTTDRVKESIFNKLQSYIPGARVLDLFSGTGNLSIEALSRGAEKVVAIEMNRKSLDIIQKNLEKLKITEIDVFAVDVFKFLKKYDAEPFDIILCDPPFTEKIAHDLFLAISSSKTFKDSSIVVTESSSQERLDDRYPPLYLFDRRDYGDKYVSYFAVDTENIAKPEDRPTENKD